jgi:DNA polymerase III alpha subunit
MTELYHVDEAGICWLSEQGVIELAYKGTLQDSLFEWQDDVVKREYVHMCESQDNWPFTFNDVNRVHDRGWFTPAEYAQIDLAQYVLTRCKSPAEQTRATYELKLIDQLKVHDIFRHLIYLVDTWRSRNLVWGIGRGSSVSCFILYVIGLNRINPLDYDLDPEEFFKCKLETE